MISDRVAALLQEQVGHELQASHKYLGIAAYFAHQGLDGWAALFYEQSAEEKTHAMKIVRFLTDAGRPLAFPALTEATTGFGSALEAVNAALKSEQTVSSQFRTMAKAAMEEGDFTAFEFLQWFIKEQVEEESKMQKLIDLVSSGINLFQAEAVLPKDEEEEDED